MVDGQFSKRSVLMPLVSGEILNNRLHFKNSKSKYTSYNLRVNQQGIETNGTLIHWYDTLMGTTTLENYLELSLKT